LLAELVTHISRAKLLPLDELLLLLLLCALCWFHAAEEDEAAQLQRADVTVYQQGQLTTTVSVVDMDPDR
jgi:lipopolysaccharide export system protein LptC